MYTVDLNNYFPEAKKEPVLLLLFTDQFFFKLFTYLFNHNMYISKSWIF